MFTFTPVLVHLILPLFCGVSPKIKVTKLNSFEKNYEERVTEARNIELLYLRKELAVWAMTLVLIVISPMMATAATFSVYVLIDENNVLTPSRSFSVLLLFSALRFPINFAGRLLGSKCIQIADPPPPEHGFLTNTFLDRGDPGILRSKTNIVVSRTRVANCREFKAC
jgi:hypothetical protein